MKELLDEHLHEEEQKVPRWWEKYAFYVYRKLYLVTFAVAGSMLLLLFLRGGVGSDFDAVLALVVLWGLMVNLFNKTCQHFWTSAIVATILLFGVFLNYASSLVATIHNKDLLYVTHWRWSHYELIFMGERSFFTALVECSEWLLFYILLTTIVAEIVGLGIEKK